MTHFSIYYRLTLVGRGRSRDRSYGSDILRKRSGTKELWLGGTLLLVPLLVLCVCTIDFPVAVLIKTHLYGNRHWSRWTSNLPDLLLGVVLLVTGVAFAMYRVRLTKGICDVLTSFARLVTFATPASYLAKNLCKSVFGRINTRIWLQNPDPYDYGFHWFNRESGYEGFPSGHMLVVVTILACFWRFYPRSRPACVALAGALGVALIATDYHFVSDVIAGAYLGLVVEAVTFRLLVQDPRRIGFPAI